MLENYRRMHLGSSLLGFMIQQARGLGDYMCLHVHVGNHQALTFYKKMGFGVREVVHDYYLKNQGVEPPDAFFLTRNLRE